MTHADERQAAYQVRVDGADITRTLQGRLISWSLTDNRGFEVDQLDLVLDDADGKLGFPARGAEIRFAIGWTDTGLVDKGSYTVDEIEHHGAPDQLTIRARSADMRGGLTTQRERSFHGQTLGAIVRTVADEVGLVPVVAASLDTVALAHVDQTNESAANLLTRLARMHDAIATVKDGKLLLFPAGGGVTATGKPLPVVTITRDVGDDHRFTLADRESFTHVRATWHDLGAGTKGEVIWGKAEDDAERNKRPTQVPSATLEPTAFKAVGTKQKSRAKAVRLAAKEWKRLSTSAAFRAQYAGVKVAYADRTLMAQGEVTHGVTEDRKARQGALRQSERDAAKLAGAAPAVAIDHSADNIKTIRHVYASKANATHAVRAEWRRLQRGMATFGITLAHGREDLFPELPATVKGFKPAIDNTDWIVTRVTHSGGDGGFTTAVELEIRATEIPG